MRHPPLDPHDAVFVVGPGRVQGGRRDGRATAARVGLSGPAGPGAPPEGPEAGGTAWSPHSLWRNIRATWSGFRRVLALVWAAHPGLTLGLAALNLGRGGLP